MNFVCHTVITVTWKNKSIHYNVMKQHVTLHSEMRRMVGSHAT